MRQGKIYSQTRDSLDKTVLFARLLNVYEYYVISIILAKLVKYVSKVFFAYPACSYFFNKPTQGHLSVQKTVNSEFYNPLHAFLVILHLSQNNTPLIPNP